LADWLLSTPTKENLKEKYMSTFGDQVFQFGGAPVGLPVTFGTGAGKGPGKVFFVNPTSGSDGNVGTRMDKPFSTIAAAYAAATSNNHDMIVLSANAAHAATDQLSVTKNRTHFLGLDCAGRYYGQRSRWTMGVTSGSAIAIVKNTGVGNSWQNIKFDSSDTLSTSIYAFAEGGEYTVLEHCEIYKSTDLDQATAAELLMNGDSALIRKCTIGSLANTVSAARTNVLLTTGTISGKAARDVTFEDCLFWLKSSSATASHFHATTAADVERMLLIKNCVMVVAKLSTATVGDAIIVDTAQTEGQIIVVNSCNVNSTALGTTGSVGIVYYGPEIATAATAGNPVAVTD
jgi:hypothetical protein